MDFSNKVALVTGAARGIGRACAAELARRGATVIINDRPGDPELATTAESIGAAESVEADAFSRSGCEQLVEAVVAKVGRIDILISNPAYSRRGAFLDYSPDEFQRTVAGTLVAGFHISQLAARQMVRQGDGGALLFISSVQAEMPLGHSSAYGASKAGLNHLMRSIAVELAPHRIRSNAIEPGWIDTPGERASFGEQAIRDEGQRLPWGRMGQPEDIGRAAAFLVSDEADYITGAVLPVDGCFRFKDCLVDNLIDPQAK